MDLNKISVNSDGNWKGPEQNDYSIINGKLDVEVCFKEIEDFIISKIEKHSYIVGCVAWLTNKNIYISVNSSIPKYALKQRVPTDINSGVIIFKNTNWSQTFLHNIITNIEVKKYWNNSFAENIVLKQLVCIKEVTVGRKK